MEPRVQFKTFKGFPAHDEKIETEAFLIAAQEVVHGFANFGKLFTPVINDMQGNITKLTKAFDKDRIKNRYLEDLIIFNEIVDTFAADALLWLKRGLQLICIFFENICNDTSKTETLKRHLQDAYEQTLKPFHSFIVQSTVRIIYSWMPSRTQLIGDGLVHDENIQYMEAYLPPMRNYLNAIDELLKKYNLDDPGKV